MRILSFSTPPKVTLRDDSKVGSPAKERLNLGRWGGEEGEERGEEGGDGGRDKKELVDRRQRRRRGVIECWGMGRHLVEVGGVEMGRGQGSAWGICYGVSGVEKVRLVGREAGMAERGAGMERGAGRGWWSGGWWRGRRGWWGGGRGWWGRGRGWWSGRCGR